MPTEKLANIGSDRHQSRLVEFRLLDPNNTAGQVHVTPFETKCFAQAQPGPIEKEEHCSECLSSHRTPTLFLTQRCGVEKMLDFRARVYMWDEVF